jgi:dienelactone hydrolase
LKFPGPDCPHKVDAPAQVGSVDLVFNDIVPGTYAFTTWHDANSDGKTNLPAEGFAFGNNAPVPATFKAAAIEVSGNTTAEVTLFYMARPTAANTGEMGAAAPQGVLKTDVRQAGLYGALYTPTEARNLPAIIAIGGSEGGLDVTSSAAKSFSEHGYVVLALAYWRAPGLPQALEKVRLEYFKDAIDWLKTRTEVDAGRIGFVGLSRGAEGALLIASHYPDIKAVMAVAPSSHLWPASSMNLGDGGGDAARQPAWVLDGKPLPFLALKAGPNGAAPSNNLAPYERALADAQANSESEIPVDRINGPILLLSGEQDGIWPAGPMAQRIVARLKAHNFSYGYTHIEYAGAGHLVFLGDPEDLGDLSRYRMLSGAMGGTDAANLAARSDSWSRSLAFFDQALKKPGR